MCMPTNRKIAQLRHVRQLQQRTRGGPTAMAAPDFAWPCACCHCRTFCVVMAKNEKMLCQKRWQKMPQSKKCCAKKDGKKVPHPPVWPYPSRMWTPNTMRNSSNTSAAIGAEPVTARKKMFFFQYLWNKFAAFLLPPSSQISCTLPPSC